MLEKWKNTLDKCGFVCAIFMDFSKAFRTRTICFNFRNLQEFKSERKRTVFYGIETISYHASQLWTILLEEFKQGNTISLFKSDAR